MQTGSSQNDNTYFIDPENGAEAARLIDQDLMITRNMGGLFPPEFDLSSIKQVLDVACGPGGWAREVALAHPHMQVVGIDIHRSMIQYAQAFVQVQQLANIQFYVMNALEPLKFADASFDLVNARFMVGFLSRTSWPVVVREMARVTRPGGIIRLTEADDGGTTTSAALGRIEELLARAFYLMGRGFASEGRHVGVISRLSTFLREAGVEDIHEQEHHLDFSAGAPAYISNYNNYRVGYKLLQPFLVKAGVTTDEEFEALYNQMMEDMLSPSFQGDCAYMSVWGRKQPV